MHRTGWGGGVVPRPVTLRVENSYTPVVRLLTQSAQDGVGGGGVVPRPVTLRVENSYTPVVRLHTQCTGLGGGGEGCTSSSHTDG